MAAILNPLWVTEQKALISNRHIVPYNVVVSFTQAKVFVVTTLTNLNIPFKMYSLGSGVVRITTDTDNLSVLQKEAIMGTKRKPSLETAGKKLFLFLHDGRPGNEHAWEGLAAEAKKRYIKMAIAVWQEVDNCL